MLGLRGGGRVGFHPTDWTHGWHGLIVRVFRQCARDNFQSYCQAAVNMYGTDPKLRKMAEQIIKSQQKEIAELQKWPKSHPMKHWSPPPSYFLTTRSMLHFGHFPGLFEVTSGCMGHV